MVPFLATVFSIICILLIVVVLLQKGRGGGLGGAFGGIGSSAFGTRTGDVFTWVTIVLTGIFLLMAVFTNIMFRPEPQPVSALLFVPDSKPISKPTAVTIQCATPKARIFYTLDGTQPTRNSLRYDAPVRIEPGTTLKARAFLRGWKPSPLKVARYPRPGQTQPATSPTTAPAPGR